MTSNSRAESRTDLSAQQSVPEAKIVGYVTEKQEFSIYLE